MKKIAAFFTALCIFIVIIAAFHFSMNGDLEMNNKSMGTWINPYKDLSYNAISQNIHSDTMLVLGSSEFRHGKKTIYHPAKLFKKQNVSLMMVGGPYNQCLYHSIVLGSVEKQLKKKKVVLMLSPTWFYKGGVDGEKYALRFSETEYMAFMENSSIPKSTKEYVAKRSEKLLTSDNSMLTRVKMYDRMFVYGHGTSVDNILYKIRKAYVTDKDYITVNGVLKTTKISKLSSYNDSVKSPKSINWGSLEEKAAKGASKRSHNPFFMSDRVWAKKFAARAKISKGIHNSETYKTSPEYDDLQCFLDICKDNNIKPMLVILPQNGYWYDYTGITAAKRAYFAKRIKKMAKANNAEVADFTGDDYMPYIMVDAAHPWGVGWVKINEKVYKFYNQN